MPIFIIKRRIKMKTKIIKTTIEEMFEHDVISVDIPLMIRLLEYAREDAQSDLDLHIITEKMLDIGNNINTLTMKNYNNIVNI